MARVTVIGDVGGHADHLRAALAAVGAYPRVPDNAFVIQVGDLVDRGPDSPGVLALVDCSGKVRQRASVDWQARHTRVRIGGRQFVGIDPKLGKTGAAQWSPPILDGEVFR